MASLEPGNPETVLAAAKRMLDARDPAGARALLQGAVQAGTRSLEIPLLLAIACRMQGDLRASVAALDAALAIDPCSFLALLSKGAALEALGDHRAAVAVYKNSLKVAPPMSEMAPGLVAHFEAARKAVQQDTEALHRHLQNAVAGVRARHPGAEMDRFDECLTIFAGRATPFVHRPSLLHFPRLPAIPFYDRALFPWLPTLEAATGVIRGELMTVLHEDQASLEPYIQYPKGTPVNQWQQLNHSPAWSSYFLWRDGRKVEEHCARCPRTAALLESLPMAQQPGYSPTAMFSVLAPHTHIPPHTGSTNVRLIVHLPLILPPNCRYRVGNDHRNWEMGKAWVFDDSIEHEAWNDSDEVRVLLLLDVWNPLVSETERELVIAMLAAAREYA